MGGVSPQVNHYDFFHTPFFLYTLYLFLFRVAWRCSCWFLTQPFFQERYFRLVIMTTTPPPDYPWMPRPEGLPHYMMNKGSLSINTKMPGLFEICFRILPLDERYALQSWHQTQYLLGTLPNLCSLRLLGRLVAWSLLRLLLFVPFLACLYSFWQRMPCRSLTGPFLRPISILIKCFHGVVDFLLVWPLFSSFLHFEEKSFGPRNSHFILFWRECLLVVSISQIQ